MDITIYLKRHDEAVNPHQIAIYGGHNNMVVPPTTATLADQIVVVGSKVDERGAGEQSISVIPF